MTKRTPVQVLIDRDVADNIKQNFGDSPNTPITWIFNHLGRMLAAGKIPLQALKPKQESSQESQQE